MRYIYGLVPTNQNERCVVWVSSKFDWDKVSPFEASLGSRQTSKGRDVLGGWVHLPCHIWDQRCKESPTLDSKSYPLHTTPQLSSKVSLLPNEVPSKFNYSQMKLLTGSDCHDKWGSVTWPLTREELFLACSHRGSIRHWLYGQTAGLAAYRGLWEIKIHKLRRKDQIELCWDEGKKESVVLKSDSMWIWVS